MSGRKTGWEDMATTCKSLPLNSIWCMSLVRAIPCGSCQNWAVGRISSLSAGGPLGFEKPRLATESYKEYIHRSSDITLVSFSKVEISSLLVSRPKSPSSNSLIREKNWSRSFSVSISKTNSQISPKELQIRSIGQNRKYHYPDDRSSSF